MNETYIKNKAHGDFNRVRFKENFHKLRNILTPDKQELLSLEYVKYLLKPKKETYRGMKAVPISLIVGSEGRYRDFNSTFLPKHEHIRNRWENVDRAHIKDVVLPPIKLYEIGTVYFVRDGNHRVSVARAQGVDFIDAEIISLESEINLRPGMTKDDLKKIIIAYEKERFFEKTNIEDIIPRENLDFTATGRFVEIIRHIEGHKKELENDLKRKIDFKNAARSWYNTIFIPITDIYREKKQLARFKGRTKADLYVWIVKHWNELKKRYGSDFSAEKAAIDYSTRYGKTLFGRIKAVLFNKNDRRCYKK